MERGFEH